MRVLFISGWAANNGLSRSTVHPHLTQLATYESVDKIVYISIEPAPGDSYKEASGKVEHAPIVRSSYANGLVSRIIDQISVRKAILDQSKRLNPEIVICRGAQAGALGHMIWNKFAIPYYVESFEPHAEYMVESRVWSRYGIKYLVQRNWEEKIKRTATLLITVSEGYAKRLIEHENISPDRLRTVPCWVDKELFRFNQESRELVRAGLGIGDSIVGIYLGQFGGLYYDLEAIRALKVVRDSVRIPLHILILTPSDQTKISKALIGIGFNTTDFSLRYVNYEQIPAYLSSADFGISSVRSTPIAAYCSPIKYGEYWACGLPILASRGVGDESAWMDSEGLGCSADFLDPRSIEQAARNIVDMLQLSHHREKIRITGTSKRSKDALIRVYDEIVAKYEC